VCWSATADLVAGSAVGAVGVASLLSVRRIREVPLAGLPLLLGAHQWTEVVVWWGQEGRVGPATAATARTLWAVIAFPLLPVLLPVAVLLVAAPSRRRVLLALVLVGTAASAALLGAVADGPVSAEVAGHTLRYGVGVPLPQLVGVGYVLATVGALLVSGQRDIRLLGIVCGLGAAACLTLWQAAFVSTWCALAAVASLFVLRWITRAHRRA
jgi:hypothetical protein